MRWLGLVGLNDAAHLCADLSRYVMWLCVGSLIAGGAVWCAGYGAYQEWAAAHPPPAVRTRRERDLAREVSRGIAALESYLAASAPAPGSDPGRRRPRPRPLPSERGDTQP